MFGVGLGLNYSTFLSGPGFTTSPINAMWAGQSLIDRMDAASFLAALPSGSVYADAAVGGQPLLKTTSDLSGSLEPWVDNTGGSLADGLLLTSYLSIVDAGYDNRTDVTAVVYQTANAERYRLSEDGAGTSNVTPEEFKLGFLYLVGRWRAEHGSGVKIVVGLPHRRNAVGVTDPDREAYGFQKQREMYIEVIDADPLMEGVEHCDIDLADATHHTVGAGDIVFGSRVGNMMNYLVNGGVKPDYPIAQSATRNYGNVVVTFDTDITQPSAGVGQVACESGGALVLGSSLTRTSDKVATFVLADNAGLRMDDTPYVRIGSGVNATLANTNADTLMNGNDDLPARGAYVPITDINPVSSLAKTLVCFDAKYSKKTYDGGTNISIIEGMTGEGFDTHTNAANSDFVYDSSLFGGRGGLKDNNVGTACMQNIDQMVIDGAKTIWGVIDIPSTLDGVRILTFGVNDGSGDTDSSFYITAGGFSFAKNQAGGFQQIASGTFTGTNIFCFRFNNTGSVDFFLNSEEPIFTFDPRDDYAAYSSIHIGARGSQTNGLKNLGVGHIGISDDALTNTEWLAIVTHLGSEFSKTIT